MLNSNTVEEWVNRILNDIISSEHSEIILKVIKVSKKKKTKTPFLKKFSKIGYKCYSFIDSKINNRVENNPFIKKEFDTENKIKTIFIEPKETKFSDYFSQKDIKELKIYDIDIFLRFGFRILRGNILKVANYGLWSFHHGDSATNRGGPSGFWEVYEERNVSGVTLQVLSEDLDGGMVLSKGLYSTVKRSMFLNKVNFYNKSADLLINELNKLYNFGANKYFKMVSKNNNTPTFYDNKLYKPPSNIISLFYYSDNFFSSEE